MTLRERWQRLVSRKSLYSSSGNSNSSQSSSSSTTDPTESRPALSSGTTTPLPVPISASTPHPLAPILNPTSAKDDSSNSSPKPSLLSKSLTWRSSHGHSSSHPKLPSSWTKKARTANNATGGQTLPRRRVHPSERPLTEANLRQQEELSAFKWEFGRKGSLGGWSVESGISPCGSRRPSYDLTLHDMPMPPTS